LIKEGDRVLLVSEEGDEFLVKLQKGLKYVTHIGTIMHDEIIGKPYGGSIETSRGIRLFLLQPGIVDDIYNMKRRTQIVYPKDIGFIILMLDVKEGDRVIDAGVGSGAMSYALARAVGVNGKVYAYERRQDFCSIAIENFKNWGIEERIELKLRDISDGFDEKNVDALFLDVPTPWEYLAQAWQALKGGGRLGMVVPTTNQVQEVLKVLYDLPFIRIEVWENFFRPYKPVPDRLRPVDRMVAHTAFMIFATKFC